MMSRHQPESKDPLSYGEVREFLQMRGKCCVPNNLSAIMILLFDRLGRIMDRVFQKRS